MDHSKLKGSTKFTLGIILFLVVTPLLVYSNCGSVAEDATDLQSSESIDPSVHQKVFIDIAGEHIKPNKIKSKENHEKPKP